MDTKGYIEALLSEAVAAVELDRRIYAKVKERAKKEGRTIFEQTMRSAQEAVSAELKRDGWKIGNTYDSATWQAPAGTNFKSN